MEHIRTQFLRFESIIFLNYFITVVWCQTTGHNYAARHRMLEGLNKRRCTFFSCLSI